MSDASGAAWVRNELMEQRRPPVRTSGTLVWLRDRLFGTPTNILLTLLSVLLLWYTVVPAFQFMVIDAVWSGTDRTSCLAETVGRPVGACWPFIEAKFSQFMYGFYPESQRWRVDVTFLLAALLLAPLLIPRAPAKTLNALLFFGALPVLAFFLLYGGGLDGFAISWVVGSLEAIAASIGSGGEWLRASGAALELPLISQLLWVLGKALILLNSGLQYLLLPLSWLRDTLQLSNEPVWNDFLLSACAVSALAVLWLRSGRALLISLGIFAGIAAVIALLGLHRGGLPIVITREWGGMLVTMVVSVTGIVASMPVGIVLALGRRSSIPLIRILAIGFIEFWRGVPLITVLFFATYMLPLFMPQGFHIDGMVRVLVGVSLFAGAYNAEVIRGGLAAIPRGQFEAASALGLSYGKTTGLVIMPQALRNVIPGIVNSFIALFKDTTLVLIVSIFDLLGQLRASFADPNWATPSTLFTGFAFAGIIYFVFCFAMSRYSLSVEQRLNAHQRH